VNTGRQPPRADEANRQIQIDGPDVLAYGEMLDRMAEALGRLPWPKLPVPLLTPRLSWVWIGWATPVDAGVARPVIEGLSTATIVTDISAAQLFDVAPMPFEEALWRAVADDDTTVSTHRTAGREPRPATFANTTP
jgi:hypothetical protein